MDPPSQPPKKQKSFDCPGWISSSFEAATTSDTKTQKLQSRFRKPKQQRSYTSKRKYSRIKSNQDDVSWPEMFFPQTKENLAVHKKKVSEVEDYLRSGLKSCALSQHEPCLLLLTGPAGAGKTATVKVLAKELNADICEWSSSIYETSSGTIFPESNSKGFMYADGFRQTQTSTFRDFFLRANKYPSLFSTTSHRIVLVEEFPNAFLKDPSLFHNVIRAFHKIGRYPVVFIISDCTTGDSQENLLFPKDFQAELKVRHISFNPVAPTMLLKTLSSICASQGQDLSKKDLENIAADSMGDIRSAINALHFSCTKGAVRQESSVLPVKRDAKTPKGEEQSRARDAPLFLFHSLGKILYSKRDASIESDKNSLPAHLSDMSRFPLVSNPEEVFEKTSISASGFSLFLHENYLSFIDDLEVAADCASVFAEADALCTEWAGRDVLNEYASSLVTRGLMFNLRPTSAGNRWCPLRKPQYFSSVKNYRNSCVSLRHTFSDSRLTSRELQTELIPYLSKIGSGSKNAKQTQAVREFGQMTVKRMFRPRHEQLSANDVIQDTNSLESCVTDLNLDTVESYDATSEEEEIVIEEYDSD